MTGEPLFVPVIVAKRSNMFSKLCTQHTCYVAEGGTLEDLRIVLEGDQVMATYDTFYAQGMEFGRSAERHVKWVTAREVECITILSPHMATNGENDLNVEGYGTPRPLPTSSAIVEFFDLSAGLATGVDVSSPDGPRHSGLPVVGNLPISQIDMVRTEHELNEVVVCSSPREAAYCQSGWTKRSIDASLSTLLSLSGSKGLILPNDLYSTAAISVFGRYIHSKCRITLASQPQAHPMFTSAVENALSTHDDHERAANLASVFDRFGHVFVSSVEMGGMKHLHSAKTDGTQRTREQCEDAMRRTLGIKFGPPTADASGDTGSPQISGVQETLGFECCVVDTVGGAIGESSLSPWKASLPYPKNWSVTRVISVEPTINLFDADVRSRIIAAIQRPSESPAPPIPEPSYPQIIETGIFRSVHLAHTSPRSIDFVHPAQPPAQLVLGLRALDFEHSSNVRVNCTVDAITAASASVNIHSWANTVNHATSCSWLKIPPNCHGIQCGSYNISQDHPWYKPQEVTTHRVTFAQPFEGPPRVTAWLHCLDLEHQTPNRVVVDALDVTTEGFTIKVATWGGSKIYSAGVSWVAISASRTDITCGRYSTNSVRPWNPPIQETSGHCTFSGVTFTSTPHLFLAICSVDFGKGRNVRFRELCASKVTSQGFEWHLDTFADSIMYTGAAAYVAFAS